MTAVEQVLTTALGLIKKPDHWTQGRYRESVGGHDAYCSMGALREAGNLLFPDAKTSGVGGVGRLEAIMTADALLSRVTGEFDIIRWNDAPHTTHQDVVAAFKQAIERAHNKEGDADGGI